MWGVLVNLLVGAAATIMPSLVGRVMLALGVGFVTYKGIDVGISALRLQAISSIQGIGGDALQLLGFLWVDKAISVLFSAVTVSLVMRGVGAASKKLIFPSLFK